MWLHRQAMRYAIAATLAVTTSALSSYSPPPPKLVKQCAWQQTHCATAPQFRNVVNGTRATRTGLGIGA